MLSSIKGGMLMESWYSIYEIGRLRHRELERKYGNPHVLRAYAVKRKEQKSRIKKMIRKSMATFGGYLETWGQMLQKKFQTC